MSEAAEQTELGIGAPVRRREDARFITGQGRYTDDINQTGQLYAIFCRSPYARAQINSIDKTEALAVDGVVAVLTGAEMVADGLGDLPCGWLVKDKLGEDMKSSPHPPMAAKVANYVTLQEVYHADPVLSELCLMAAYSYAKSGLTLAEAA